MTISQTIAELTRKLDYSTLETSVAEQAKYLLLDYLGVTIRGSRSDSSQQIHRFLKGNHVCSQGPPVIGTDIRVEASFAALANGIAALSLELDDVVNAASLHPSATIMSASLSAASVTNCSGLELLEGIIAGYELAVKLGIALDPVAHYQRGFHPTGTCGTLGSALAAAKILKLDPEGIVNAIGIAGSQAAGSMEYNVDGSPTKRFHAGWAAHAGLVAALLAKEGFSGPASIIEGKQGFLHAYSTGSDSKKVLTGWGDPYQVLKSSIKPYACCRYQQGSIDCILAIVKENNLTEADIEKVEVSILEAGFALVAKPVEARQNPQSVADAQFSMPFGAAVAILEGDAFLDQYTRENITSPVVKDLMRRVVCVRNPELDKEFPTKWPAEVKITTRTGQSFRKGTQYPKGDPENPLSRDEIIEKFFKLATAVFDENQCRMIVNRVLQLEGESSLKHLMAALQKRGGG